MSPITSIIIWLACSLSILIILFTFKNGRKDRIKYYWVRREGIRSYRRRKAYSKEYLRQLRTKMIKPKTARAFLPLIIMLIIAFFLVNNFVFLTVITSDSMSPTFNRGDMVLMTQYKEVDEGDIIMFTIINEPRPIVHRISGIEENNISTKGDFNYKEDPWTINESAIHSKAVTIGGKPVVLKGVGVYFIEDYQADGPYSQEIEINRLILQGMKTTAVFIFFLAVVLYIYFTIIDIRHRKV